MKLYTLLHKHRHGDGNSMFKSNKDLTGYYDIENLPGKQVNRVIEELKIDFEPDRGETIEINEVEPVGKIKVIEF